MVAGLLLLAGLSVFVPAGDASDTITELARQMQLQVLFDYPLVKGRPTDEVSCDCAPDEAFDHLLLGTGLNFEFTNYRTIAISEFHHFNIPTQDICESLKAWQTQSRTFVGALCWCRTPVNAVQGLMTPVQSLATMLTGTRVKHEVRANGMVLFWWDCSAPTPAPLTRPPRKRRVPAPVEHSCTCAQTWDGVPLGRWCYDETGALNYAPSCER